MAASAEARDAALVAQGLAKGLARQIPTSSTVCARDFDVRAPSISRSTKLCRPNESSMWLKNGSGVAIVALPRAVQIQPRGSGFLVFRSTVAWRMCPNYGGRRCPVKLVHAGGSELGAGRCRGHIQDVADLLP